MKCTICGKETQKGRCVCRGCNAVKKTAKSREHTPEGTMKLASKHLDENPGLLSISWPKFWKKNSKTIV